MCYTRQRVQRSSFKRRKVFGGCSIPASKGVSSKEGIFSLGKGAFKTEVSDSCTTPRGGWFSCKLC